MSRNGSGTYTLPAGNPVVTGTTITSSWANTTMQNIADGLTQSVSNDGQTPMSGALNMATNKINNLGTPAVSTDAATKAYVDLTQTASGITGGTITGATLTNDTIDSTPIGSTTRSTVKATTLDLGLSTQSVAIGQGNSSIMKNRIINGAMVIDQRNAGASVTLSTDTYTLDRWIGFAGVASKMSIQQNAGSVTLPTGFTNYLGVTSLTAYTPLAATDVFGVSQAIEGYNIADLGWGTANAKTITISFQVYSSLTGTFGGLVKNNAGTRAYGFTYSIPIANTWTTISTTIAGDTSGTWLTTNGLGLRLIFDLGTGSTYRVAAGSWTAGNYYGVTGATSVVSTSGATFYITGVQLEVGSSATGFEYRQYQQELALCQRYCWVQTGNGAGAIRYATSGVAGGSNLFPSVQHPVTMRAAPSIAVSSPSHFQTETWAAGTIQTATAISINQSTVNSTVLTVTVGSAVGNGGNLNGTNASASMTISAEL
jgi:hypothetical protein